MVYKYGLSIYCTCITICRSVDNISGGCRNCKTGGRGPGAVELLGIGFVLMPLHTYPIFWVTRVVNKIHNINIVC